MRIALKLVAALVLAMLALLGLNAVVRLRREVNLFDEQLRRSSHLVGRSLAGAAARIWETVGEARAQDLVADANERDAHLTIRWVWLDGQDPQRAPLAGPAGLEPARAGREVALRSALPGGEAILTYAPIPRAGARAAAVELRAPLDDEQDYVRTTIRNTLLVTAALVAVCGLLALGLGVALIGRPLALLADKARRVGTGDLEGELRLPQRDEIGGLAAEVDAMCRRLSEAQRRVAEEAAARTKATEQLRHADRLTTVGKLAAGIAHELGTPLNVVTGRAQLIAEDVAPASPAARSAAIIADQSARMAAIIRQLLDFARSRQPKIATEDVTALAREAARMLESLARAKGVELRVEGGPQRAPVDAGQLQQVLTNLVVNGIQAMPAGGPITLTVSRGRAQPPGGQGPEAEFVRVAVRDRGSGIEPADLPRVFEPFFTTKEVSQGTGLGLSVAWGIVREHGGWIEAQSEPGRGSEFTVHLPAEAA